MGHIKPKITEEHINQINHLIDTNPDWNRTTLSKELCEVWGWKSPAGQIKDISCRDLLRALDKKGLIHLPAARWATRIPGCSADKVICDEHDTRPVEAKLSDITPIQIKIVKTVDDTRLFKSCIQQYHYLGFDRSVGENIRYLVYSNSGTILSCLMFGSAAWSCADRDYYLGWGKGQRAENLMYITNNSRFLILPWIHVPHLATHILGAVSRRISGDWQMKYGHRLLMLETCVEKGRFRGTCYKAANWRHVGVTTGLGRNSRTGEQVLPLKDILIYPLCGDYKERLCGHKCAPVGKQKVICHG